MSSKHLKVALDIEQDSVLLEESIETIDFVPTEGKDIGRIPILTTVFFFLVVVIINRNWNPQNSFQSYSELSTNCLSREYGPVKEGYDLVAYHSLEPGSRGIKGDSAFSSLYEGYTFWFTSDLNREAFEVNPRRYLPMFGGFCAWGIATEEWWTASTLGPPGNPDHWEIIDGSLYLFFTDDVRKLFMAKSNVTSTADLIAQGRVKWGDWFGGDAAYSTASSEICACQYLRGPNSCE